MADFKPLLLVLLLFIGIGGFLNLAVSPFVDSSTPDPDSVLEGLSNFINDGWTINITIPIFGEVSTSISPITWFWLGIDPVTNFVVEQINLISYIDDRLSIPMALIMIVALAYAILSFVRGN